ncbi:hypothetical protein [Parasitella parasitica]|uniref:C2H2-type domain-containing protein n=1 Tax=Parasitella parasitica TaxID=35722 RepID=A0A0B7NF31_9FUNG|nr:hypothetical protein [Parasitella parasitica]
MSHISNNSPPSTFGLYPSETKQEAHVQYTSPYEYYTSYSFMPYKQQATTVVSPPLTPAVSPLTPMLMDSNSDQFSISHSHHHHQQQQQQQQDYHHSYVSFQETSHSAFAHNGSSDSSVTSSTINSPLAHTQHKHVCHFHYCGWSFKRYEHLKRHMLVHTGERPYSCHFPGCGKSFSRSDNFHAHYRTHTKKKLPKKRSTKASVTMDKTCHRNSAFSLLASAGKSRPNSIISNLCTASNVAANAAAAVAVSQQLEPNNNGVYYHTQSMINDFYPTTFQTLSPISSPTPAAIPAATTTSMKTHICPIIQCQGRFKRLEHLKRHMRIHTLEKPFSCSFPGCQKSFSRSDNLSQHVKTHTKSADKRRRK